MLSVQTKMNYEQFLDKVSKIVKNDSIKTHSLVSCNIVTEEESSFNFKELDMILEEICFNIPYLRYKKLMESVEIKYIRPSLKNLSLSCNDRPIYFNTFKQRSLDLKVLYDFLVTHNLIQ